MEGAGAPQHLIKFHGHSSGVLGGKVERSISLLIIAFYPYTYVTISIRMKYDTVATYSYPK